MEAYHRAEIGPSDDIEPGMLVVYDLSEGEAWTRARQELRAWGTAFADIHRLDNDHILIAFRPGAARRLAG